MLAPAATGATNIKGSTTLNSARCTLVYMYSYERKIKRKRDGFANCILMVLCIAARAARDYFQDLRTFTNLLRENSTIIAERFLCTINLCVYTTFIYNACVYINFIYILGEIERMNCEYSLPVVVV